jgi:hypothetical protein
MLGLLRNDISLFLDTTRAGMAALADPAPAAIPELAAAADMTGAVGPERLGINMLFTRH